MFYVGQKVVCVDDSGDFKLYPDARPPIKGQIYTIRKIKHYKKDWGFLLVEIINPPGRYGWPVPFITEQFFDHWRFRPVVERKTDISVFTHILDQANQKVGV